MNFFYSREFKHPLTLRELHSDLLSQNAFSAIKGVDLSPLMRCLQPQEAVMEPDEIWEWSKLFTDVVAEIHSDKTSVHTQVGIAADEIMPSFS